MDKKTRSKIIGGLAFIIILTLCVVGLTLTKKDNERMDKLLAMSVDNSEKNETNIDNHEEYVDLGLPSGTKWKLSNEEDPSDIDAFYTYDDAVEHFGHRLPRVDQWQELRNECQWEWKVFYSIVTGPNGNSMVLPALGYLDCDGDMGAPGYKGGCYWSSTPYSTGAWAFEFSSEERVLWGVFGTERCNGLSVRLVKD